MAEKGTALFYSCSITGEFPTSTSSGGNCSEITQAEWRVIRDPYSMNDVSLGLFSAGNRGAALKCSLCLCIIEALSALARQQAVHLDELQVNNCHLTPQSASLAFPFGFSMDKID